MSGPVQEFTVCISGNIISLTSVSNYLNIFKCFCIIIHISEWNCHFTENKFPMSIHFSMCNCYLLLSMFRTKERGLGDIFHLLSLSACCLTLIILSLSQHSYKFPIWVLITYLKMLQYISYLWNILLLLFCLKIISSTFTVLLEINDHNCLIFLALVLTRPSNELLSSVFKCFNFFSCFSIFLF